MAQLTMNGIPFSWINPTTQKFLSSFGSRVYDIYSDNVSVGHCQKTPAYKPVK